MNWIMSHLKCRNLVPILILLVIVPKFKALADTIVLFCTQTPSKDVFLLILSNYTLTTDYV